MRTRYKRRLLGALPIMAAHRRTRSADLQLAIVLAAVAGGVNAGGFLIVGQYTSHMTGYLSSIPDNLTVNALGAAGTALVAILSFILGAGVSAMLIEWGKRHTRSRQYAFPIMAQAALLLVFPGVAMGPEALAAFWLCFVMGIQNATITRISGARMRTTHVTGMVTDIGMELGKALYWNRAQALPHVRADLRTLRILFLVVGAFVAGGFAGAMAFATIGAAAAIPFAVILFAVALPALVRLSRKGAGRRSAPET